MNLVVLDWLFCLHYLIRGGLECEFIFIRNYIVENCERKDRLLTRYTNREEEKEEGLNVKMGSKKFRSYIVSAILIIVFNNGFHHAFNLLLTDCFLICWFKKNV